MSRFLKEAFRSLEVYVPGEQPRYKKYIKLNTNESPFPPSPEVLEAVAKEAGDLQLYSDPECTALRKTAAELVHKFIVQVIGADIRKYIRDA